jgi:uncharacterized protein involved in outer membrane biogenesis
MVWIKRIAVLLSATLLCLSAFLVGIVVFFDNAAYSRAAVWVADTFFNSDLHIGGEMTLHLGETLELNVGNIQLDARDDSYHFSSKKLQTAIQLRPLLSGTLWLNELQVDQLFLRVNETTTQSSGLFDPRLLPVVIASANFQGLVFEYQEIPPGTLHRISLNKLWLDDIADKGPIGIQGDGQFEGQSFRLRGELPSIEAALEPDRPSPVKLDVTGKIGHVKIDGTISDFMNGKGMDLQLDVALQDTRLLLEWLDDGVPELGELRVNARLRGDYADPRLEDIDANLHRGTEVDVNVSGSVDNIYNGAGLSLQIKGNSTQPDVASWLLFNKLDQLNSLELKAGLGEKDGHFYISDMDAAASTRKGLSVKVHGNTEIYFGGKLPLKTDSGINAEFSAPTTAALNLFDTAHVPELGALSGSARLHISSDSIRLDNTDVRIGGKGDSTIRLQGQVRDIPLHENAVAGGIDMQLSVQSPDVAALAEKLNYSLATIGPGQARMKVSGDLDKLHLKDVNIRAGSKDGLQITARGNINRVVLGKSASVGSALFDVAATTTDLSKLSTLTGIQLPELGQTGMSSTMTLTGQDLQFDNLEVNIGRPDQPTIRLHGTVTTQLYKGSTVHVDYSVSVADLVAAFADQPPGYLGRLHGNAEISDIDGSWGIEKFELASSHTSLYEIDLQGGYDDLKNSDLVNIQVNLEIGDPAALGNALGVSLPSVKPYRGQGRLTRKNDVLAYHGTMSVGKTTSTTSIHGHTLKDKPTFRGNFSIPVLDLTDFGYLLEQEAASELVAKPESSAKDYLFSRKPLPVDLLNDFGLDLQINIDKIESYGKASIDSVVGHITLQDGQLMVDPLQFVYASGNMDVVFSLQAAERPVYTLKVVADDLVLGPMLAQVQNNTPLDGRTNILLDLTGSGQSAHQLASSLNGRINIEFENARIPRLYADYLSVDVFGWALSTSMGEKYINLNCVVADFTADKGEVKSKVLLADGPNLSLGGRLDLDLREETVDAVLLPRQKRRLFSQINPIRLSGPIRNPRVVAIPAKAAIQEIGLLALSPTIYLSSRMLEKVWLSVSKGDDAGEGCTNIDKLTDEAEKARKKKPVWQNLFSNESLID